MRWKLLLILQISLLLYLTIGAFIFQALERKPTAGQHVNSTAAYVNFTQYLAEQYPNIGKEEALDLMTDMIQAYKAGIIGLPGAVEDDPWELSRSFFFVSTVITTIGYGNIAPVTLGGRMATIIYALFGIPLCLIFLAGLGEKIVKMLKKIETCFSVCERCTSFWHIVRVCLLIVLGWAIFIMLPAWAFSAVEGWTYAQSVYFAFVTLSTIGFGDVVPTSVDGRRNPLYRIISVVWVYVGLAWLSSLVSLLSDIFQKGVSEGQSKVEEKLKKSHKNLTTKIKHFNSQISQRDEKHGDVTHMKQEAINGGDSSIKDGTHLETENDGKENSQTAENGNGIMEVIREDERIVSVSL